MDLTLVDFDGARDAIYRATSQAEYDRALQEAYRLCDEARVQRDPENGLSAFALCLAGWRYAFYRGSVAAINLAKQFERLATEQWQRLDNSARAEYYRVGYATSAARMARNRGDLAKAKEYLEGLPKGAAQQYPMQFAFLRKHEAYILACSGQKSDHTIDSALETMKALGTRKGTALAHYTKGLIAGDVRIGLTGHVLEDRRPKCFLIVIDRINHSLNSFCYLFEVFFVGLGKIR